MCVWVCVCVPSLTASKTRRRSKKKKSMGGWVGWGVVVVVVGYKIKSELESQVGFQRAFLKR